MAKIIKNTTGSPIVIDTVGLTIPAGGSYTIEVSEYLLWASVEVLTELTPDITAGFLVVNDGYYDLAVGDGINFLEYPDTAFNGRFLSDPERVNGFVSKTIQEAIEEAAAGSVTGIAPTTTIGAVTAVAYSLGLDDNTTYVLDCRTVCRRTDSVGDTGDWQLELKVKRESGGPATVVGHTLQKRAERTDSLMDVYWDVSGNNVQLKVVGVAAKTIKWQPQIEQVKVS